MQLNPFNPTDLQIYTSLNTKQMEVSGLGGVRGMGVVTKVIWSSPLPEMGVTINAKLMQPVTCRNRLLKGLIKLAGSLGWIG